ncbi:hypothetical protein V2J09_002044 [Rumex salicifolius]
MKIIKSLLRNRLGDELMNDCLVTYNEKDATRSIETEDIIKRFQKMAPRRMLLSHLMSTPPSDHSTLVVSDGGPEDAENREKTTTVNPAWTWFSRHCLREIGEMSFSEMELEEDKMAYKKLFAVLEKEPYDNHFSVTVWIIQVILLVIFIILVSTFASVHVIHREWLHMRVHSWVALLMVVVSGYPVIRFVTFVVSEPLVWVWMRNNKYVYFFARFLKQSVDLTLWFTLLLWG